jgi:hypothetical protein
LSAELVESFKVFDYSNQNLVQFVKQGFFHRCDQFLMPWLRGIEHKLT